MDLAQDALLQTWLTQVGITSYTQLARSSGVGLAVITRLRKGQVSQIPIGKVARLAQALKRSPLELMEHFGQIQWQEPAWEAEYRRLEIVLKEQPHQIQLQNYRAVEALLTQYPTAHYLAHQHPQWPARNVTALFVSLGHLIQHWDLITIGSVGERVLFDPTQHQCADPVSTGDPVYIRFVGYRRYDQLLTRAKVSRTALEIPR